ncbi:hypothetical protein [Streptomyces qaidamensis]|uniref:hypothetical protein n=1 Tax=Streptomyces qaidamensis TaxID=1783515 RepID=UPI00131E2280
MSSTLFRPLALRARAAPARRVVADDRMRAAVAHRLACEGTGLLWRLAADRGVSPTGGPAG